MNALLNEWYERCAGPAAAGSLNAYYQLWETFWIEDIPGIQLVYQAGTISTVQSDRISQRRGARDAGGKSDPFGYSV